MNKKEVTLPFDVQVLIVCLFVKPNKILSACKLTQINVIIFCKVYYNGWAGSCPACLLWKQKDFKWYWFDYYWIIIITIACNIGVWTYGVSRGSLDSQSAGFSEAASWARDLQGCYLSTSSSIELEKEGTPFDSYLSNSFLFGAITLA